MTETRHRAEGSGRAWPAEYDLDDDEPVPEDQRYLDICYELAKRSDCVKAKFGSIVVKNGKIFGSGYNTSPNPNFKDCNHLCAGGIRKGVASGTRLESCYATHAEQWALLEAGIESKGATVYVAGFLADGTKASKDFSKPLGNPKAGFYCTFCARLIWAAGCKGVVVDSLDGPRFQTLEQMWKSSYAVAQTGV